MGFKKTVEGRVFFSNQDTANRNAPPALRRERERENQRDDQRDDQEDRAQGEIRERLRERERSDRDRFSTQPLTRNVGAPTSGATGQPGLQMQILTLLRALNDKLKVSQSERLAMQAELSRTRQRVEAVEQQRVNISQTAEARAARAEKIAQETMAELSETRRMVMEIDDKANEADKNVSALKGQMLETKRLNAALIKKQDGLETRQNELGTRVETAITQQDQLIRKIDKALEDRLRLMRKIERIEETVLQTRDALNARAMLFLSGQSDESNPAGQPLLAAASPLRADADFTASEAAPSLHQWARSMQALAIVVVAIAAMLGGWLVNELQQPTYPAFEDLTQDITQAITPASDPAQNLGSEPEIAVPLAADIPPPPTAQPQSDMQDQAQDQALAQTEPGIPPSAPGADIAAQMGVDALNDEEALVAALEKDPKALAQSLNKIEPSRTDATKPAPKSAPQEEPQKEKPQPKAAAAPAPEDLKPEDLKPDATLPAVVKQIEDKAFKGNAEAQHDLAAIYTAGHGGVRQDYARAAAWFEKAALSGVANAAYNLGVLYHQGLGMKPDMKKALTWYQKAADQNHPEAQYNLGIAYIEGIGVDYDPQKAKTYFENAADQKIMEAAYNLGLIYENGLLGPSAPDEALMWYQTAADQGSPEAKAALEQLSKTLSLSPKEVARVVEETRRLRKPGSGDTTPKTKPPTNNTPAKESAHNAAQDTAKQVQDYLMRAGLYPGPADGKAGPLMRDAVRSYQALNGLHIDGEVSADLLSHMQAQPKLR